LLLINIFQRVQGQRLFLGFSSSSLIDLSKLIKRTVLRLETYSNDLCRMIQTYRQTVGTDIWLIVFQLPFNLFAF